MTIAWVFPGQGSQNTLVDLLKRMVPRLERLTVPSVASIEQQRGRQQHG